MHDTFESAFRIITWYDKAYFFQLMTRTGKVRLLLLVNDLYEVGDSGYLIEHFRFTAVFEEHYPRFVN